MSTKKNRSRFAATVLRLVQTDFCPSLNQYVYWLKEPVGWFVVALMSSILIGAFFSPIGWPIAAGIAAVLMLGLGFPWIAMRTIRCELRCANEELHEGDESYLLLRVRNPLPIPVLGVVVEDYFQSGESSEPDGSGVWAAECGLSQVPAMSSAEYRLPIRPIYRGRYPAGNPKVACGFPFGIYTSRQSIGKVRPVVVRPLVLPLVSELEFSGVKMAEAGDGHRPMEHGEFLGVREFRRGDALRSIHWAQSARLDELVVCERGGPQKSPLRLRLDTTRCGDSHGEAIDNLAWRVRVVATLVDLLSARHLPFELWIDEQLKPIPSGSNAATAAWDALAEVPLLGKSSVVVSESSSANGALTSQTSNRFDGQRQVAVAPIANDHDGNAFRYIQVSFHFPSQGNSLHRNRTDATSNAGVAGAVHTIDLTSDIDLQLEQILKESSREIAA